MRLVLLAAFAFATLPTAASATAWGTLTVIAEREWTTEKEPRPRVSKFRWVTPDKVLEAKHGFVSRLQFGEGKFADTVQRFVIDPKTGAINVTYTYEDGRPPLKSTIAIESDGTAIETFTDAKGVKKRNIYKSPSPSVNVIERQEMRDGKWATLGTTRKAGLTQLEIAENKRRAEEARQFAIAQENARIAAARARAQREAEQARQQAAYEDEQNNQPEEQQGMGLNMLDVLNGLASSINQQNQRQTPSYNSGGSSSGGGAIIVDNSPPPPAYVPPAYTPPPSAPVQSEPERPKKDCWGRLITSGSSSSSSSSSGSSKVCPE